MSRPTESSGNGHLQQGHSTSPSETYLLLVLRQIREADPFAGAATIQLKLRAERNWAVSLSRVRSMLRANGLTARLGSQSQLNAVLSIRQSSTAAETLPNPDGIYEYLPTGYKLKLDKICEYLPMEDNVNFNLYKVKAAEALQSAPRKKTQKSNKEVVDTAEEMLTRVALPCSEAYLQQYRIVKDGLKKHFQEGKIIKQDYLRDLDLLFNIIQDLEYDCADLIANAARYREDLFDSLSTLPYMADIAIGSVFKDARLGATAKREEDIQTEAYLKWRWENPSDYRRDFPREPFVEKADKFYSCQKYYRDPRCYESDPEETKWWCCATGLWIDRDGRMADHEFAQIVPQCTSDSSLAYMFGCRSEDLQEARNALPLASMIEEMFHLQRITIVPAECDSDENTPSTWQIFVIDKSIMEEHFSLMENGKHVRMKYGDMHRQLLQFRNLNRPARRYLYFRHCAAYLKAIKERDTGNWGNWDVSELPTGDIWGTLAKPDGYLRAPFLHVLGATVGDIKLPEDNDSDANTMNLVNDDVEFRFHAGELVKAIKTWEKRVSRRQREEQEWILFTSY